MLARIKTYMKTLKFIALITLLAGVLASPLTGSADEAKKEKAKAYPLKTCVVSDEKFGGDMGEPYVFVQDGREVKLCCKSCLKDFKKDTAKYMKKIEEGEAKEKAKK
jgi:hypothetical protein